MSPRGGKRPGAGRPVSTGRGWAAGGTTVTIQLSQDERARAEDVLRDGEKSVAGLARALLIAEVERRELAARRRQGSP